MSIKPWLERRANAEVGPRDGKADALDRGAHENLSAADVVAVPAPVEDHAKSRRDEVNGVLAQKVLHAFVRNRLQISFPLALNLSRHPRVEVDLLLEAAVVAALASGAPGRPHLADALAGAHLSEADLERLTDLLHRPERSLNALCGEVRAAKLAPHAYAIAVMALPRPDACEQAFLNYLAERLDLRPDAVSGITRRYRR